MESDNLNNKYSKLNKLVQRKENLKEEKIILNGQRLAKRKMVVNLEREKNKKYGEFISSLEEEVKLSNQELDGQLEIPGVSRVKRR